MSTKLIRKILIPCFVLIAFFSISVNIKAADCALYVVQKGDCLWAISQNYQVQLSEVISYNPQFKDPDLIYPGDEVYVPVNVVDREKTTQTPIIEPPSTEAPIIVPQITEAPSTEPPSTEVPSTEAPIWEAPSVEPPAAEVPSTEAPRNSGPTIGDLTDMESQVLVLVNAERAKVGLPELKLNMEVTTIARAKSKDMIDKNYFDHTSPTYGSPSQMLTSFGIKYRASGENIAYGQKTAQEVMNSWMNSSGHRANILNSTFTEIGIGCVIKSNGQPYWTQLFITP